MKSNVSWLTARRVGVGLLLNIKYPGSTTWFCVGLLLNLEYPGSTTGFWCGFVAQSLIFCVVVYGPLLIFLLACLSLYCYVTARRGHNRGGTDNTMAKTKVRKDK
jgi:hypothetical protein